jgi:TRAP-type C4-dicarboxylate transport system substrate-binding protein
LTAGLLGACGSGASDKLGGVPDPVVLRISSQSDDEFSAFFTDEVRRLSKGRIRFEFAPGRGRPPGEADHDLRVAQQVSAGRYDLALVPAYAWDELGVTSLEPLQAPLLISDQTLFKAILASPLTERMLAGLRAEHVVGLGMMMSLLNHPLGYERALRAPADFRGMRIRVPLSRVNDTVIAALGARPLHLDFDAEGPMAARREIDGEELPFFAPPHAWITANVTLFASAMTIVANGARFSRLADAQRRVLQEAATRAGRRAISLMTGDYAEPKITVLYCRGGHVVVATPQELAALQHAMRPIYDRLERDAKVRAIIAGIEEIKRRTPPDPLPKLPAACARPEPAVSGAARDPSFLNGTYRWRITRAGARKVGGSPDDPVVGTTMEMTLKDGRFLDMGGDHGTFEVIGDRLVLSFSDAAEPETFSFKRGDDGALYLRPVLPMDVGTRVVFASSPWTRVGPPVRIP